MTRRLRLTFGLFGLLGLFAGLGTLSAQTPGTTGTAAGMPAQGQPAAGSPTPGARQAGVPSAGQPAAGNPFSARTSNVSGNNTALPSGNTLQPGNPFSTFTTGSGFPNGTFTNGTFPNGTNGAFFGNQFVPGTGVPFGVAGGVAGFAPGVLGADGNWYAGNGVNPYDTTGQTNVVGLTTNANPAAGNTTLAVGLGTSSNGVAAVCDTSMASVARLRLLVPADAAVWIDGQRTAPTGYLREYISPRIDPNREYGYDIRAEWNENGQPVTRSRKVTFFAGDRLTINLLDKGSEKNGIVVHQTLKRSEPGSPESVVKKDDGGLTLTPPPLASFEVASDEGAHDGTIVLVTPTTLHIKAQDERVYQYDLAPGAQITCDNSACPLSAIKPGMRARVTTKNNQLNRALRVEAVEHNLDFVKPSR